MPVTKLGQESKKYWEIVRDTLHDWYIKFAKFTPNFIAGIIVFLLFYYASNFLSKISVRFFQKLFPKKKETIVSLAGFFRFLIIMTGAFLALEIMGLSSFLWKMLGSLGVAGIIAGVALQSIATSVFSGLLVGMDKAFKEGDNVTIEGYSGTVQEVGLLTTKIITDDGKKVYIPNQLIFSKPFFNVTASPQRKIILDFEIPNSENLEKAKQALTDGLKSLSFVANPGQAQVIFVQQKLGSYSLQVKFEVKPGDNVAIDRSNAILELKNKLDAAGVKTASNVNQPVS